MEDEFKKNCLHCGVSFTSKRGDKKYCNDTCRQMAYFKRHGLSLAGTQPASNQNNNLVENYKQKPAVKNNAAPLSIKNVKGEENTSNVKCTSEMPVQDQAMEALINRLMDAMEQRFNLRIEKLKQELEVKYSNQPDKPETTQTPVEKPVQLCNPVSFSDQVNILLEKIFPIKYGNPSKGLNLKYASGENNFTADKNVLENKREVDNKEPSEMESTHVQQEAEKTDTAKRPVQRYYHEVKSRFTKYIDEEFFADEIEIGGKFLRPSNSDWSTADIQKITWLNLRLRCLFGSLIKLSNYAKIDSHTLLCISDAFNRLVKSKTYQLMRVYPCKKLIEELSVKLNDLVIANANQERIVFRLPLKRKVKLIYIHHELVYSVPAIKFSELNFDEPEYKN